MNKEEEAKKALEALHVLAAQIGNARLRKEWKDPIEGFIRTFIGRRVKPDAPDDENKS